MLEANRTSRIPSISSSTSGVSFGSTSSAPKLSSSCHEKQGSSQSIRQSELRLAAWSSGAQAMEQVDNIIVVWASVKIGRRREALGYAEAVSQVITCAKEELPKMSPSAVED